MEIYLNVGKGSLKKVLEKEKVLLYNRYMK